MRLLFLAISVIHVLLGRKGPVWYTYSTIYSHPPIGWCSSREPSVNQPTSGRFKPIPKKNTRHLNQSSLMYGSKTIDTLPILDTQQKNGRN